MSRLDSVATAVGIMLLIATAIVLGRPSGLVGQELFSRLEKRREVRAVNANWTKLAALDEGSAPVKTVVEFLDYRCTFCRAFGDTLKRFLAAEPTAMLIVRHAPRPGDTQSRRAALGVLCADEQGNMTPLHEALLRGAWWESATDSTLADTAQVPDVARFMECLSSARAADALRADSVLGAIIGIRGTPAFPVRDYGVFYGVPSVARMKEWLADH